MTEHTGYASLSAGSDAAIPDISAAAQAAWFFGSSGQADVDALIYGTRWTGTLTYSIPRSMGDYSGYTGWNNETWSFVAVSPMMVEAVRATLTGGSAHQNVLGAMSVAALTGLNIVQVDGGAGDLRYGQTSRTQTAMAYLPSSSPLGGDVWFNSSTYANPRLGNYAYHTVLHETGHALGLKHPHEYSPYLDYARDSIEFTVMSYRSYAGSARDMYRYGEWDGPQSYMMLDIAALQTLYGADYVTRSGATNYSWDPNSGQMFIDGIGQGTPGGNRVFLTLWDGGGHDVYDLSNYATDLRVDLAPGASSLISGSQLANLGDGHRASGNVYNALLYQGDTRSLIEDARGGSGHDTIQGNQAANTLWGNAGNDTLEGREGNDLLIGGEGFDVAVLRGQFLTGGAEGRLESRVMAWEASGVTVTTYRITSGNRAGEAVDSDRLVGIETLRFTDGAIVLDGTALLDPFDYARGNQDVFRAGLNAHSHYDQFGWREGRDPSEHFSTRGYLSANADVRAAGINPLDHYQADGWREGRDPSAGFDLRLYRLYNPDVAAANIDPLTHYAQFGQAEGRRIGAAIGDDIRGGFDATYYLLANPDVGMAGLSAEAHYRQFGWREGRDSSAWFDTSAYLAAYADVRAAGIDPLAHYMANGWREGRDPSAGFDSSAYLTAYADVAAAGVNPLQHFLTSGIYEGRSPFSDGVIG
ncbi:M10 family metallopeptidase [Pseudoroseomonas cervicalis]|uniref:M10 family metallopeptidase n=1 Tax=Teichococcus cervicalis TaxID=204525 RepID=UPI0027854C5B|nr:M10 family metallopeptidase [Pseudoroseomonas cervicalis]MDQ1080328.1 serralysin [Pseudoroseomonas cervicalis]